MKDLSTNPLRVLVEAEGGGFLTQCVDYDIAGEGTTVDGAVESFIRMFIKNVLAAVQLGVEPLASVPPAPAEYAARWEQATHRIDREIKQFKIPAFAVVEKGAELPPDFFGEVEAAVPLDSAA